MLHEFRFENYRSFRDSAVLSMEASGLGMYKDCLIQCGAKKYLPAVAIYGKNGGGKSNVIRAFWLAARFINYAQMTQHEGAEIPVKPFALNDYSDQQPTAFDFVYKYNGVKYWYGFAATKTQIISEYLYHAPKGQKALVFERNLQSFNFTQEKNTRELISKMVAPNQLFFSVACTMNDTDCVTAMKWFRSCLFFSRDYTDLPPRLIENSENQKMLDAIASYATAADVGIDSVRFEFNQNEITEDVTFPKGMPDNLKKALSSFIHTLSETSNNSEVKLQMGAVKATTAHKGKNKDNSVTSYEMPLDTESDGTRKLMSLAPAIESALNIGGVLFVDELERELHPALVNYIVAKFQNKHSNPKGAQLIFTTHNTELLNMEILRKDQLYFVDKQPDGASELYSVSDFGTRTTENIRKGYLLGKYGAIPDVEIEEIR